MTKTEFNILLLLIQNKNRVVPRESIIKHIWPDAVSLTMHALDTHIANIRRKIGGAGRSDLLYTVAKIGYRLS